MDGQRFRKRGFRKGDWRAVRKSAIEFRDAGCFCVLVFKQKRARIENELSSHASFRFDACLCGQFGRLARLVSRRECKLAVDQDTRPNKPGNRGSDLDYEPLLKDLSDFCGHKSGWNDLMYASIRD